MLPDDENIKECSSCVHRDNKWYENPCFRCSSLNDYFWYSKDESKQNNK